MKDLEFKKQIIEAFKDKTKTNINYLQNNITELQKSANNYGQPKDRYDSFRSQLSRKRDMFAKQLHQSNIQLNILENINVSSKNNTVKFGSLVFTNDQNILVSIGIGKITFENKTYFAISENVPIYSALEGKKKGDICDFRGKKIELLEVF